ncbi:hypothetical protein NSS76_09435 [Bacillus sp. FSL R5-0654]|nr:MULTISPECIES: hypothetical protein [Bacillus]
MKSRMLEIAGDVLDTFAAEWVRELLDHEDEEFLYLLMGSSQQFAGR